MLRAFHSADIGITTAATSNVSSMWIVLALVAGRRDCQPALTLSVNSRCYECFSSNCQVSNSTYHDCKYAL